MVLRKPCVKDHETLARIAFSRYANRRTDVCQSVDRNERDSTVAAAAKLVRDARIRSNGDTIDLRSRPEGRNVVQIFTFPAHRRSRTVPRAERIRIAAA